VGSSAKMISGLARQCPTHRHPLLLPARQLARPVLRAVAQADRVDHPVEPGPVGLPPGQVHGEVMISRAVSVGTRL
jgi:hypothetical protein